MEGSKSKRRPSKISESERTSIGRTVLLNLWVSAELIGVKANALASSGTIRRALHETGCNRSIAANVLFLTDKHAIDKLVFVWKYKNWTVEDLKNVIWTDEATFGIDEKSRHVVVSRIVKKCSSLNVGASI